MAAAPHFQLAPASSPTGPFNASRLLQNFVLAGTLQSNPLATHALLYNPASGAKARSHRDMMATIAAEILDCRHDFWMMQAVASPLPNDRPVLALAPVHHAIDRVIGRNFNRCAFRLARVNALAAALSRAAMQHVLGQPVRAGDLTMAPFDFERVGPNLISVNLDSLWPDHIPATLAHVFLVPQVGLVPMPAAHVAPNKSLMRENEMDWQSVFPWADWDSYW